MTVPLSAQEYWGNPQLVWEDGSGLGQVFDPCFAYNADQILISMEEFSNYKRILRVTALWVDEPLFPDSITGDGHDDTPFMTSDGNTVYFSSNRSGGFGGFDIWYTQYLGGDWMMPVNLGANINSSMDEISPSVVSDESELFFIRGDYNGYDPVSNGTIMYSEFSGGQWQQPSDLPESINSVENEYSPSISGDGSKLYFISERENGLQGMNAVWVSVRTGDIWETPYMPEGCINLYYQDCPPWWGWYGAPLSVCVMADDSRLVYVKAHHFMCFEPNSLVYIAEHMTGIENANIEFPLELSLTIYPNPFNSMVNIQMLGAGKGSILIYDILGREVQNFGRIDSGDLITWDGKNGSGDHCPSGIYFLRLQSGDHAATRNVTLIR